MYPRTAMGKEAGAQKQEITFFAMFKACSNKKTPAEILSRCFIFLPV
jgi:hypothetical protein